MTEASPISAAGATPVPAPIDTGPKTKLHHATTERVRFAMELRAGTTLRIGEIASAAHVADGTIANALGCLVRHRIVEKLDRGLYRLPQAKIRKGTRMPASAPTVEPGAASAVDEPWRARNRPAAELSAEVERELAGMAGDEKSCGCGDEHSTADGIDHLGTVSELQLDPAQTAVYAETVTSPLTIDKRRRAITEIAKAYDAAGECYDAGVSDATIAAGLDVPVEAVATIRAENFGPLRASPICELIEIEAELSRVRDRVVMLLDRLNVARRNFLVERA